MGTNVTGSQPFSSDVYLTQIFPDLFNSAFENAMTVHSQAGGLLMDVTSDTEQNIYTFLSQSIGMQKWEGERKVRELSGSEFTVVNDDFELTYGIKRDALLDRSRIQGISDYITKMGEAAAEHKDRLAWEFLDLQGTTALCYDGTPLIGATHPLKKGSDWSNIDTTGAGPKWFLMDTRTSNRAVLFQTRESYALEVLNADGENNVRGFMRREHLVGAFSRVAVAPAMPHRIFQSTALLDVGTGAPPCPLHGGLYGGARMKTMEEAVRFYNFFDLTLSEEPRELPDHLTTQLEFLHFLAFREAQTLEAGADAGSWQRAQRDFLGRHPGRWVPQLRARLEKEEPMPFFRELVARLAAFLESDAQRLCEVAPES